MKTKMKFYLLLSIELIFISFIFAEHVSDVTKFGADIKGVTKSTEAVKKAIEDAVSKGGGTVFFPKEEYLCGPIHLKSNITLHLADNSVIKLNKDFDDYLPMILMRWEGTEGHRRAQKGTEGHRSHQFLASYLCLQ